MLPQIDTNAWLLWFYQFAFAILPGVAFLAVTIGVYLIYEFVDRALEQRQKKPIDPGVRGLPDIALGQILAVFFALLVRTALSAGVAFVGIVVIFLINWMRDPVQTAASQLEEGQSIIASSEPHFSTDFVVLVSLFGIGVSLVSIVLLYSTFRRLAQEWRTAASSAKALGSEPLFVRLFGDVRFSGLAVMFVLFYPILGIVMQFVWLIVLVVPLPASVTQIATSGSFAAITWVLLVLWLIMIVTLASPFIGLLRRWVLMTLAHYRANRVFNGIVKAYVAVLVGFLGLSVSMLIQIEIGTRFYPAYYSW